MRISTLAFASLRRRKTKAALLAAGIGAGIATVVALLSLGSSIRSEIGAQLDQYGANIVVVPQSDSLALDYGGVSAAAVAFDAHELTSADLTALERIPYANRLSVIAPKLLGGVEVQGKRLVLAGVDFERELRLKPWWSVQGRPPKEADELLLGSEVARSLGVVDGASQPPASYGRSHHHGEVAVPSADSVGPSKSHANPGDARVLKKEQLRIGESDFRIAGVLAPTAGPEDRMLFASLPTAQVLLNKPASLSLIEISALCKDCPVEDIVSQINDGLPHARASAVQQAVQARERTVAQLSKFGAAVGGVVLLIGALLVFNTMSGSVLERTSEIGVLRAIGFRKSHIVRGLLIEVAVISIVGGAVGWILGTLASRAALPYFAETQIDFAWRPELLPAAIVASLLIGVLSGLYPIWRAAHLDPADAIRNT